MSCCCWENENNIRAAAWNSILWVTFILSFCSPLEWRVQFWIASVILIFYFNLFFRSQCYKVFARKYSSGMSVWLILWLRLISRKIFTVKRLKWPNQMVDGELPAFRSMSLSEFCDKLFYDSREDEYNFVRLFTNT